MKEWQNEQYEHIVNMNWKETHEVAKKCFVNADRLFESSGLLLQNNFIEQAYNNIYISLEEFYKAKIFETISYIKFSNQNFKQQLLKEFVKSYLNHKIKFNEIFDKTQLNLNNVSIKTNENIDDTEIQNNFQKEINQIFKNLEQSNFYNLKNNSLYVSYNSTSKEFTSPQQLITKNFVTNALKMCFLVKLYCNINLESDKPSIGVEQLLDWLD
jgi:AbiV family abortive infection protein